jgi:hypothetical protein
MHSNLQLTLFSLSCLSGLAALGCAADVEHEPAAVAMAEQTLAEVRIGGAQVRFVEQRAGLPLAVALTERGQANPLLDPAIQGKDVVQIYEYLTHEPAPPALQAARSRARAVAAELDPAEAIDPGASDQPPQAIELIDKAALSDQQFLDRYCHGSPSTQICNLSVTGTGEYQRYTPAVWGYVNPYRGEVRLQIRVKFITGWENVYVSDVPQSKEFSYMQSYIIKREIKVKVFEADGDGYHWGHGWI